MKTAFSITALAVLLVAPSPCLADWGIAPVSKEQAKELGLEVRSEGAGRNHVLVELEFKTEGALKSFSRVELPGALCRREVRAGGPVQAHRVRRHRPPEAWFTADLAGDDPAGCEPRQPRHQVRSGVRSDQASSSRPARGEPMASYGSAGTSFGCAVIGTMIARPKDLTGADGHTVFIWHQVP